MALVDLAAVRQRDAARVGARRRAGEVEPSSSVTWNSIAPCGAAGSARSGTRGGASSDSVSEGGSARARVSSISRSSDSRASACVRAGRPKQSSSASLVAVETSVCAPVTSHHSGAIPAACGERVDFAHVGRRARPSAETGVSARISTRARRPAACGRRVRSARRGGRRRWCRAATRQTKPGRDSGRRSEVARAAVEGDQHAIEPVRRRRRRTPPSARRRRASPNARRRCNGSSASRHSTSSGAPSATRLAASARPARAARDARRAARRAGRRRRRASASACVQSSQEIALSWA